MSSAFRRTKLLSSSRWHLLGVASFLGGSAAASAYSYYHFIYLPQNKLKLNLALPPPQRRTHLYVSGTPDGTGLLPDRPSMSRVAFILDVFYELVVEFLSNMGPSYIKLGQWMATRPDIFPPDLCTRLEKLFDDTVPHNWQHTEGLLRRMYTEGSSKGHNALYYLLDIEKKPINSGSIAQIHRATLRESIDGVPAGTELAIKVTHPHIREQIAADITALRILVRLVNTIVPGAKSFNLETTLNEFSSLIRSQLDLMIECDNLQRFIWNFYNVPGVIFPTPLPTLCSEDVLFETYEPGIPLQTVECSADNAEIAELGCHMFLKMLFEDNFAHSDLHPGNLLLRLNSDLSKPYPNGKPKVAKEIIVLDAGLVTSLSKEERCNFISLFGAVACGDGELGAELMLDRLPENQQQKRGPVNREKFKADMKEIFDLVSPNVQGFKLSNIRIGHVFERIMNTMRENNACVDGNFASLVLTVMIGEGLGRKLTPDFNIFSEATPYLVAFLEEGELFFLAKKLRETYGATTLLRDSVELVNPKKANTYIEVVAKRGSSLAHKVRDATYVKSGSESDSSVLG